MENFSIGEVVRARWQEAARRATVACPPEDGEIEVIFNDDGSEALLAAQHVFPLLAFESTPPACCSGASLSADAARCREEGNCLFKLGDAAAAAERYTAAIDGLGSIHGTDEVRMPVLASSRHCLWLAHATSRRSNLLELQFARAVGGMVPVPVDLPPNMMAKKERVLLIQQEALADLQAALYLNRSRCWLALGAPAQAVQDCSLVAALRDASLHGLAPAQEARHRAGRQPIEAESDGALDRPTTDARLCTAYFLRGKARVRQGRLSAAESDLQRATVSATEAQANDLQRLKSEIAEARKSNKRLAREVSKWCEAAMAKANPDAFAAVTDAGVG